MKLRMATAPVSWGIWFPEDPKQMPWVRFLDEVNAAGFEYIELGPYGYLPVFSSARGYACRPRGTKRSIPRGHRPGPSVPLPRHGTPRLPRRRSRRLPPAP